MDRNIKIQSGFSELALIDLLQRQICSFFPLSEQEVLRLSVALPNVLQRCAYCFQQTNNKYIVQSSDGVSFNPYISSQYLIYLYYFSNTLYRSSVLPSELSLCDKLYYLNKIMHAVDILYAVDLPRSFSVEHPVGSVMGRAHYGDQFMFYQGCTVGGTHKNGLPIYPTIGTSVTMYANSSILGDCHIGDNVMIGAGALVKNENIPEGTMVFGQSPHLIVKNRIHV